MDCANDTPDVQALSPKVLPGPTSQIVGPLGLYQDPSRRLIFHDMLAASQFWKC